MICNLDLDANRLFSYIVNRVAFLNSGTGKSSAVKIQWRDDNRYYLISSTIVILSNASRAYRRWDITGDWGCGRNLECFFVTLSK